MAGSKFWASSFVTLTSGKKLYLATHYSELKAQMRSKKQTIEVETSNLFSKKYCIQKKNIETYGKM